jgi:hypothetical protein
MQQTQTHRYTFRNQPKPQEALKQQDWKIERLARDNRALEAANCDLRQRVEAVREENLQVRRCYCVVKLNTPALHTRKPRSRD